MSAVELVTYRDETEHALLVTESALETKPVDELITAIERACKRDSDLLIAAALVMRELQRRHAAGEMGDGVTWYSWARKNIKCSDSYLCAIQKIAKAKDMPAAVEEHRRNARERQKNSRDNKRAAVKALTDTDKDRLTLIKFAKSAPIADVRWHLQQIEKTRGA